MRWSVRERASANTRARTLARPEERERERGSGRRVPISRLHEGEVAAARGEVERRLARGRDAVDVRAAREEERHEGREVVPGVDCAG